MNAKGVADTLMQAVAEWSGGRERFDDTTVVVLRVGALPGNP
jgi:serine phosphatase RsbU (regulator of sigma subunit)